LLEQLLVPRNLLLTLFLITYCVIFLVFTPYTHQLDELKNVIFMVVPPFLLIGLVAIVNPAGMTWKNHAPLFVLGLYTLAWWFSWLLNPYKIVGERVIWFHTACATFTVGFALLLQSERAVRRVMTYFVIMTYVGCFFGLLFNYGRVGFFLFGPNLLEILFTNMDASPWWRANPERQAWIQLVATLRSSREMYSTVLNSDFFAAFLVMMLPISAAMVFVETALWRRILALVSFLLAVICLMLTNSNDSFMSIAVQVVVFAMLVWRFHSGISLSPRFIFTFLGGLAFIGATIVLLMLPRLSNTWDFKSAAIDGRLILWGGGWYAWLYGADPARTALNWITIIFGVGPGGYRHFFPVQREPQFFDNQINNVTTYGHNHYLDVLLEVGLMGFILFMVFYGMVLVNALRQIATTRNSFFRFYQIALVSALVSIALQNFFSPNTRWTVSGMTYWSLFGLSIGVWLAERAPKILAGNIWEDRRLAPRLAYGATIALAVLFLVRSPIQGIRHWSAATENNEGLIKMDTADAIKRIIDDSRGRELTPSQVARLQELEVRREQLLTEAVTLFESSIRNNPTFSTAYYKLGHAYNQRRQPQEALRVYEALQALSPNYSEIHQNLGIMYHVVSSIPEIASTPERRLEFLEKSFESITEGARQSLKPNVQQLAGRFGRTLATEYQRVNRPERAREVLEKTKIFWRNIRDYKPLLPEFVAERKALLDDALRELARLGLETNKPNETREAFRQLLELDPTNREYLEQLIDFLDRTASPEEKAEELRQMVANNPLDMTVRRALAQALARPETGEEYIKELRRIHILDPQDRVAIAGLFMSYRAAGDTTSALTFESKLREMNVDPAIYDLGTTSPAEIHRTIILPLAEVQRLKASQHKTVEAVISASSDRTRETRTTVPLPIATITVPITATVPLSDSQRTTPGIDQPPPATPTPAEAKPAITPTPVPSMQTPRPQSSPVPAGAGEMLSSQSPSSEAPSSRRATEAHGAALEATTDSVQSHKSQSTATEVHL
jgi:tetratricopeptide (TPR) repeat protein